MLRAAVQEPPVCNGWESYALLRRRETKRAFVSATSDFSLAPCIRDVRLHFVSDNVVDIVKSDLNTSDAAVAGR